MKRLINIITIIIIFVFFAVPATAQVPPSGDGPEAKGQSQQGRRGMMFGSPEQMQQMLSNRFKEQLGVSDEEWTVIGPKVVKVLTLSVQSRGNPTRMFTGRAGAEGFNPRGPGQQGRPNTGSRFEQNAADGSLQELQTLLEDKNADASQIKQLVTKVRKAREKSQQELAAAKKELRELLTVRQEAILISMGLLD